MITPTSPTATASSALPVGTRLGEFEITGVVGEGGFGIVYSARDSNLDRIVAIKEYLPSAFSHRTGNGIVEVKSADHSKTFTAGLSSFIKEAKMLARFSHPGLVEVFRFWEANGTAYMAMRYYRGVTLRELLRATPQIVTEQWLCETLDPLLLALKVLHLEKCYHRDIAPDNILVLPNGRSVLMDFGATRRIIGGMTQALTTVLKPGFAPIEQYSDDGSMEQGAWTDIYAFGGLLYNAMTGKIPVQAISRMMSDPLKPVAELARGSFSTQLCAAVMKCLAVLPVNRYQSVDELRAALGWVTTLGVSTVTHQARASIPKVDDLLAPASFQNAVDTDATVSGVIAPVGTKVGSVLVAESPTVVDPLATLIGPITSAPIAPAPITPAPIAAAVVAAKAPAEVPTQALGRDVTAVGPAPKSKILPMAGLAIAVTVVLGVAVFLHNNSRSRSETVTAPVPPPVAVAALPVPALLEPAPQARASAAPVAENPAPPAPPAPAATNVATPPAVTTGLVRFELKDGWGTVVVDGDQKGVAPPVIIVKLAPGTHMIELRNPALPTVKRTVEVIPGKTVVVRHTFAK